MPPIIEPSPSPDTTPTRSIFARNRPRVLSPLAHREDPHSTASFKFAPQRASADSSAPESPATLSTGDTTETEVIDMTGLESTPEAEPKTPLRMRPATGPFDTSSPLTSPPPLSSPPCSPLEFLPRATTRWAPTWASTSEPSSSPIPIPTSGSAYFPTRFRGSNPMLADTATPQPAGTQRRTRAQTRVLGPPAQTLAPSLPTPTRQLTTRSLNPMFPPARVRPPPPVIRPRNLLRDRSPRSLPTDVTDAEFWASIDTAWAQVFRDPRPQVLSPDPETRAAARDSLDTALAYFLAVLMRDLATRYTAAEVVSWRRRLRAALIRLEEVVGDDNGEDDEAEEVGPGIRCWIVCAGEAYARAYRRDPGTWGFDEMSSSTDIEEMSLALVGRLKAMEAEAL